MARSFDASITKFESDEFNRLFEELLSRQPGASGIALASYDGTLLADAAPDLVNAQSVAISCSEMYLQSQNCSKELGLGELQQIIFLTAQGYVVIADYGGGLAIIFYNLHEFEFAV